MKSLLALFVSFSAFASPFSGSFKAQEVEPIMVYEYVSATCSRTLGGQTCDENGCTDNSWTEYYECGGDEWVRKGSKPLYDLEVHYQIEVKGDALYTPAISGIKEIDSGYLPEQFERTFFNRPATSMIAFAQKLKIETQEIKESSVGPGKKRLVLTGEVLVVDPIKLNTAFEEAVMVSQNEIRIESFLTQLPLKLSMCVGYDRRLSRTVKDLGCQTIEKTHLKAGRIILDKIDFSGARRNRDLVYFFKWSLDGHWLSGHNPSSPYAIFKQ